MFSCCCCCASTAASRFRERPDPAGIAGRCCCTATGQQAPSPPACQDGCPDQGAHLHERCLPGDMGLCCALGCLHGLGHRRAIKGSSCSSTSGMLLSACHSLPGSEGIMPPEAAVCSGARFSPRPGAGPKEGSAPGHIWCMPPECCCCNSGSSPAGSLQAPAAML